MANKRFGSWNRRTAKRVGARWTVSVVALIAAVASASAADPAAMETIRLRNGIEVLLMPIAGSPGVSMVLVSPMGLCSDTPGRSQWSHLTERMLAATVGEAPFDEINLETSPTAMLLKFSRDGDTWEEGVDALTSWLAPPSFPPAELERRKEALLEAVDVVVEQRGTFRYALSVWGQSLGDPISRVSIKADVERARPDELFGHYRRRFTTGTRPVIAVAGRFPREELIKALRAKIGAVPIAPVPPDALISSLGPAPDPAKRSERVTWDLPARHIVFHWALPPLDDVGKAMRTTIESGVAHLMQQRGQDYRVIKTRVTVPSGVSVDGRAYLVVEMTLRDVKEASLARARADVQQVIDGFLIEDAHARALGRLRAMGVHDMYADFDALVAGAKRRGFSRRMLEANVAVFHGLRLFIGGKGTAKQDEILHGPDVPAHAEPWKKVLSAENRRELIIVPQTAKPGPATPSGGATPKPPKSVDPPPKKPPPASVAPVSNR